MDNCHDFENKSGEIRVHQCTQIQWFSGFSEEKEHRKPLKSAATEDFHITRQFADIKLKVLDRKTAIWNKRLEILGHQNKMSSTQTWSLVVQGRFVLLKKESIGLVLKL